MTAISSRLMAVFRLELPSLGLLGICCAVMVDGLVWSEPASAQREVGKQAGVCMIADRGEGRTFVILVPRANVEAMSAKGFVRTQCSAKTASKKSRMAWRNSICALAAEPDEALQRQFTEQYGERPSVLCALAEQVVGRAKGQRTK